MSELSSSTPSQIAETTFSSKTFSTQQFDCPKCGLYNPWANELLALREQVITDPLTGLFNLRHFRSVLDIEIERTLRTGVPTALMMIDLDYFKQVNDRFGHEVGNQVLKLTAKLIGKATRQLDIQCRYGDEEFVVILPSTNLLLARQVAERLRKLIAAAEIKIDEEILRVTASLGISVRLSRDSGNAATLIKEADEALYQAKENGRNQVCFKSSEDAEREVVNLDEKAALMGMFSNYKDD